ncbi:MAG TPA: FHA domain-containing protein [Nitrospiraceae bacterium]|nr:FHA domain-containing protein [Nitrospiraceae bacterium]
MPNVGTQSPKILVKLNDTVLKEVEVARAQFAIGRKADNDLVIESSAVSGHHARIVKVQQVYFLEDLKSTNGTFINDKRIDRQQLQDTDVVAIGKHRLIFRDEVHNGAGPVPAEFDPDKTMVLKSPRTPDQPTAVPKTGIVQVISGRTDHKEYKLTGHLTIIGSQKNAAIKMSGWFAPKIAAMIGRRGAGYFVSTSDEVKTIRVNHQPVNGQVDLKDGDLLEIGKVTMYFYVKEAGK